MDISPNYSATIFGFGNAIASSSGFIITSLMDYCIAGTVSFTCFNDNVTFFIRKKKHICLKGTLEEWRSIFLYLVGVLVFGSCFFGYFANSEVEPWNTKNVKNSDACD